MQMRQLHVVLLAGLACFAACERPVAPESTDPDAITSRHAPPSTPKHSYAGLTSALNITPTGVDFGDVQVGDTSGIQRIVVTNIATLATDISGLILAPSAPFRGNTNCLTARLDPDGTCFIDYFVIPTDTGLIEGTATGTINGQQFSIALRAHSAPPSFIANPEVIDFGDVPIGATAERIVEVTKVNNGAVRVLGRSAAGFNDVFSFDLIRSTCSGIRFTFGTTCTTPVTFKPTTLGPQTVTIRHDLTLDGPTGTTLPAPAFTTVLRGNGVSTRFITDVSSIDFGEQQYGTRSLLFGINIINQTPYRIAAHFTPFPALPLIPFQASTNCIDSTYDPGESCFISVTYFPSAIDLVETGRVDGFIGSRPDELTVLLRGVGRNFPFFFEDLRVTPNGLDFGRVPVGTIGVRRVVVQNTSDFTLTLGDTFDPLPAPFRLDASSCAGQTLERGHFCVLTYTYTPGEPSEGVDSTVSTGQFFRGRGFDSHAVRLRGQGVLPEMFVSGTTLQFGDAQVGSSSGNILVGRQRVTLTNAANGMLQFFNTEPGGGIGAGYGVSDNCNEQIMVALESCALTFTVTPSALGPQEVVAHQEWNGNRFDVTLRSNGVGPRLKVNPFALDFGLVPVGVATPPTQAVLLSNVGRGSVVLNGSVSVSPPFAVVNNCQGLDIPPGVACFLQFSFDPTANGPVDVTATGSWNGFPFNVQLHGIGFGAAATTTMDISPSTISLANTATTSAILLSTPTFDATTVSLANVRMLVNGTTEVPPVSRGGTVVSSTRDWNGDGRLDRMFSFQTSQLVAAGLTTTAGPGALVLRDNISTQKWTAQDSAPPKFVP